MAERSLRNLNLHTQVDPIAAQISKIYVEPPDPRSPSLADRALCAARPYRSSGLENAIKIAQFAKNARQKASRSAPLNQLHNSYTRLVPPQEETTHLNEIG